ncbi:hypothetical protein MSBR3_2432 [Methanosarcina barkeri 3]|uniref:DUF8049 domain-containing protein n=1 Tax=Methanosarcina barkeri 3 TaxID=1434107 RepID=A0A0E3WXJ5_METBA|nr:hypothetical protein [Methanosarcina barkeri]AKB83010.1 hypothetical protein MSBR3_2432 [Methanosarcina barkeri 3]
MSRADGVKLSLVAATCTLVLVIVPENLVHIELDFASKYSPIWIFIFYLFLKDETKNNILLWYFLMVYTTAGILILEAISL